MNRLFVLMVTAALSATVCSETKITISREAPAKEVVAEGKGADEESALKDAFRKAIEQAYGLEVDAQQQMDDGKMVKDQVTTKSSAYIAGYEILEQDETLNDMVTVKIKAKVKKKKQKTPKKTESVVERVTCPECEGQRYIKVEISCTKCGGVGVMPVYIKAGIGGRRYTTGGGECPTCRGIKRITKQKACTYCNCTGKVRKEKVEGYQRRVNDDSSASSDFGGGQEMKSAGFGGGFGGND